MSQAQPVGPSSMRWKLTEFGRLLSFLLPLLLTALLNEPAWALRAALPVAALLVATTVLGRRNLTAVELALPAPVTEFEFTVTRLSVELASRGRVASRDLILHHGESTARRPVAYLASLDPEAARSLEVRLRMPSRGRQRRHSMSLSSTWPFGLLRWTATWTVDTEILALPRLGELRHPEVLLPDLGRRGLDQAQVPGPSDRFYALREWRPGLSQRHVHWRTSARLGKLVLRETRQDRKPAVLLRLETPAESCPRGSWEDSVRLTATLLEWLLREEYPVRLVWSGEHPWMLRCRPGRSGLFTALGMLAALPQTPRPGNQRPPPTSRGAYSILVAAGHGHALNARPVRLDPHDPACTALFRTQRRLALRARMEVPA